MELCYTTQRSQIIIDESHKIQQSSIYVKTYISMEKLFHSNLTTHFKHSTQEVEKRDTKSQNYES